MKKTFIKTLIFIAIGVLATLWAVGVLNMLYWFFEWIFANDLRYAIAILIGGYGATALVLNEIKKVKKTIDK